MKVFAAALSLGLATVLSTDTASAQAGAVATALSEARTRVVCGTGTLISAQYIGGGLIRVTCRQEDPRQQRSQQPSNNSPLEAGLSGPVAAGAVVGLIVLGILVGGDDETVTSSSSTAVPALR